MWLLTQLGWDSSPDIPADQLSLQQRLTPEDDGSDKLKSLAQSAVAIGAICVLVLVLLGKWMRLVICCIGALSAVGYALSAVMYLTDDSTAVWMWCATVAGIIAACLWVWVAWVSPRWVAVSRFERNTPDTYGNHTNSSTSSQRSTHGQHIPKRGGETPTRAENSDPVHTWDALSRGEDPS